MFGLTRHKPCITLRKKNCALEKYMFLEVLKFVPEFASQRMTI